MLSKEERKEYVRKLNRLHRIEYSYLTSISNTPQLLIRPVTQAIAFAAISTYVVVHPLLRFWSEDTTMVNCLSIILSALVATVVWKKKEVRTCEDKIFFELTQYQPVDVNNYNQLRSNIRATGLAEQDLAKFISSERKTIKDYLNKSSFEQGFLDRNL